MRRLITAACLLATVFALPPAWAQSAIVTQNNDEPGRNPFQEAQLSSCSAHGDCVLLFGAVPSKLRRVVEYANCEIDVVPGGSLIGVNLGSNSQKLVRAALPFTLTPALPTRAIVNAATRLYYETGEQPRVDALTLNAGVAFQLCTISGYDVKIP